MHSGNYSPATPENIINKLIAVCKKVEYINQQAIATITGTSTLYVLGSATQSITKNLPYQKPKFQKSHLSSFYFLRSSLLPATLTNKFVI